MRSPISSRGPSQILLLGLFLCLAQGAPATYGAGLGRAGDSAIAVRGQVTSLADGLPVPGATVRVAGRVAETDLEGRFQLSLPRGRYRFRFQAGGFGAASLADQRVAPGASGGPVEVAIALPPLDPDARTLRAMVDRLRNEPELSADQRGLFGPPGAVDGEQHELPVSIFSPSPPQAAPEQIRVLMPDGAIVAMNTDEYLKGVVPAEMGYLHRRGFAALQAQAIASRTYAAVRCLPASAGDPQVCEPGLDANVDTSSRTQVWRNVHYDISDAAVEATHGQVARLDGKLIDALFFARTADRTLSSEDSRCCGGRAWSFLRSASSPEAYAELWGHGAGMSQEGAAAFADWGASAQEIVEHYYAGARVDLPQRPHLYEGRVTPRAGSTEDVFSFAVSYVSWDNRPPARREVVIGDASYVMDGPTGASADYRAGVDYRFESRLSAGGHAVAFSFDDGRGEPVVLDAGRVEVAEAAGGAAGAGLGAPAARAMSEPADPLGARDAAPRAPETLAGSAALDGVAFAPLAGEAGDASPLGALALEPAGSAADGAPALDLEALTLESPVVTADFDFMAVGLRVQARPPDGGWLDLFLRSSPDGQAWSAWQPLAAEDEDGKEAAADGALWTRLAISRGRHLQVRAQVTAPRGSLSGRAEQVLDRLELHYFDSDDGPAAPLTPLHLAPEDGALSAASPGAGGEAEARPLRAAAVAVIGRAGWGADESKRRDAAGREIWPVQMTVPRAQLVHHTVTQNDPADPAAIVRAIYQYHAVSQGWGDIGYNFLVDHRGNVYEGRFGGERQGAITQGGHALQYNPNTIGVALLGTYTEGTRRPPAPMEAALVELLAEKGLRYGVDPDPPVTLAGTRFAHSVMGHRDALPGHTQCPGDGVYGRLEAVRTAVRVRLAELRGAPGNPPPPTSPPPTAPPAATLPASGCGEGLAAGGFETDDARWVRNRAYYTSWQTYRGARAMFVGLRDSDPDSATSYASAQQALRLPTRVGAARLRFAALSQGDAADQRWVRVFDASGRILALGTVNLPAVSGWTQYSYDLGAALAPLGGQEVRVYFGVVNNGDGKRSYLRLDEVSLTVCDPASAGSLPSPTPGPPTATATTAPTVGVPPASTAGPTATPEGPLCQPLLIEGFESQVGSGWWTLGGHPATWLPEGGAAGGPALRLGLSDPGADSFDYAAVARTVVLPRGLVSATLALRLSWPSRSAEDSLRVELRDPRRGLRDVLLAAPLPGGEPDGAPVTRRLSIPAGWLGRDMAQLYLAVLNRGQADAPGRVTAALVDDLRIDACWRPGLAWLPLLERLR